MMNIVKFFREWSFKFLVIMHNQRSNLKESVKEKSSPSHLDALFLP